MLVCDVSMMFNRTAFTKKKKKLHGKKKKLHEKKKKIAWKEKFLFFQIA